MQELYVDARFKDYFSKQRRKVAALPNFVLPLKCLDRRWFVTNHFVQTIKTSSKIKNKALSLHKKGNQMRSKFKKAKLKNFQKIFFQSNQKSLFQRKALKNWHQWLINKQPNTFVNWHLSNDENSTKIKCVRNRFWQSKAAMKVQNIKRQVSRKMVTNKFLEKKEQMVTKMIPLSKHKCHENKMDTKIENNLSTLPKQSNQDS